MSKYLECPVFEGNNPLTGEVIWKHRVNNVSDLEDKLKTSYQWDGYSTVATIAAKLDPDGVIASWHLYIFGKSRGSKLDASTFYHDQDEGNYLCIKEMEMANFSFQEGLVSDWLAPDKYSWEYRLPHETDKKKFYSVKDTDMAQYNAKPLWVRSLCQVIPGPKLQVFLGTAPVQKIADLPGSSQTQFPLILLEKFSIPFLPFEESGMQLGMGPIPFLMEYSEVGVTHPDGDTIKKGMSRFLKSGIKPNQRNEIKTWQKEISVGNWVARAPNHTWPDAKTLDADNNDAVEGNGDDDNDDAGQQTYYQF